MMNQNEWSVWRVSDADELGDTARVAMHYRDFSGVSLILVPEGTPGDPDWYGTERAPDGRPTRPVLVFYKGSDPTSEEVLSFLELQTANCLPSPIPETFAEVETCFSDQTIQIHLTRPPFPWLDEAKSGMEMGKYFNSVELLDWENPTEAQPGFYTLRFCRSDPKPSASFLEDDLPF